MLPDTPSRINGWVCARKERRGGGWFALRAGVLNLGAADVGGPDHLCSVRLLCALQDASRQLERSPVVRGR